MSTLHSEPVVSGQPYAVEVVNGHQAIDLADFVGEVTFLAHRDPYRHEVIGVGRVRGEVVVVHEKRDGHGGRDLRTWQVTTVADGFTAEHTAST